jgi:hypothetical protein
MASDMVVMEGMNHPHWTEPPTVLDLWFIVAVVTAACSSLQTERQAEKHRHAQNSKSSELASRRAPTKPTY